VKYVVFYEPADDFLPEARRYGAAHRTRLEQFHTRGLLLLAGPSSIPGTTAPWASSPTARPPRSSSAATRSCCMAWSAAGGSAHETSSSPGLTTGLSVGMAVSAEPPQRARRLVEVDACDARSTTGVPTSLISHAAANRDGHDPGRQGAATMRRPTPSPDTIAMLTEATNRRLARHQPRLGPGRAGGDRLDHGRR
jgi:hypothetical protein